MLYSTKLHLYSTKILLQPYILPTIFLYDNTLYDAQYKHDNPIVSLAIIQDSVITLLLDKSRLYQPQSKDHALFYETTSLFYENPLTTLYTTYYLPLW